jgi:aminoglycoside phosphotransferase family enzyme
MQTQPPSIDAKLRFLLAPTSYADPPERVEVVQTHMSWLFFVGDRVLKLKKSVRHPFLDFSTLAAREFYCREELRLNARLAPGVYLGLLALQWSDGRFALLPAERLSATGQTVDWLVLMRRLPQERMLDRMLAQGQVTPAHVDAVVAVLVGFYRSLSAVDLGATDYAAGFAREQAANREVLLRPQFELRGAAQALDGLDAALVRRGALLHERAGSGRIVDGHGDLRPEHVCLLDPPVVIDCLEFNARLRQVDPFDEMAFLALECEMAGAPWIGPRLETGCTAALGDRPPEALMHLYTAHRAMLRARLSMAHLLDPQPHTPQKWQPRAQRYVDRALTALAALDDTQ